MVELEYNISIRKKDSGLQVIVSYKDGLKWKQKSKQGFEDSREGKKEAKLFGDKIVEELKKEVNLIKLKGKLTFEDFKNLYLNHIRVHQTKNSITINETAFKKFKSLNNIEFKKIKQLDIQKVVDDLTMKGIRSTTIKTYLRVLSAAFNYGVHNDLATTNPIKNIRLLKEKDAREKRALTDEEYKTLLSKISNKRVFLITLLAGSCGMRIGEILGLTWNDIDFENKLIDVNKQWVRVKDGKYDFGPLKSINSYRKIPLPGTVYKYLLSIRNDDLDKRLIPYINTTGACSNLRESYRSIGFEISVHELRHTYATRLINNNMKLKSAARLLGHTVEVLMKKYSHETEDMMKEATTMINLIF